MKNNKNMRERLNNNLLNLLIYLCAKIYKQKLIIIMLTFVNDSSLGKALIVIY